MEKISNHKNFLIHIILCTYSSDGHFERINRFLQKCVRNDSRNNNVHSDLLEKYNLTREKS